MKTEAKLPVLCTVRTLAKLGNVSRHMVSQLLRAFGVRRVIYGRRVLVPMAEIKKKIPLLYESLQLGVSRRRQREQGKWRS
jgi:hypothetical protein